MDQQSGLCTHQPHRTSGGKFHTRLAQVTLQQKESDWRQKNTLRVNDSLSFNADTLNRHTRENLAEMAFVSVGTMWAPSGHHGHELRVQLSHADRHDHATAAARMAMYDACAHLLCERTAPYRSAFQL